MPDPCSQSKTSRCSHGINKQKQERPLWSQLLTFSSNSKHQVDVYINENAGINSLVVKGGLSTNTLGDAITRTKTEKQVENGAK